MIFYTSDLHFGHNAAIRFDNRPFSNVEDMDRIMIELWNGRVHKNDHVYILGDFCFRNKCAPECYLAQLKGIKHLIVGNHDGEIMQSEAAQWYFASIDKMLHICDDGKHICLCHFPIAEWNGARKGKPHIYGHVHAKIDDVYRFMRSRGKCYNAGCMINNYMPATFQELVANNETFDKRNGVLE